MVGKNVQAQIIVQNDVNYGDLLTSGTNQLLFVSQNGDEVYLRTTATSIDHHFKFSGVSKVIVAKNPAILFGTEWASQLFFLEMEKGGWYLLNIQENRKGEMKPIFFASASTGQIPAYMLNAEYFTAGLKLGQILLRIGNGNYDSIDMILHESAPGDCTNKLVIPHQLKLEVAFSPIP